MHCSLSMVASLLCALSLEEHSCTLAQISSVSGLHVQLNCSLRAPTKREIIIWTLRDPPLSLSENTLIYNSVPQELRQRLKITGDHSNGEYNLLVSDLRKSDEGWYECHVYGDILKFQMQKLLVIVPPTSIGLVNKDAKNRILGSEGIDLVINCTAFGGTPAPDMALQIGTEVYKLDNASSLLHTISRINRSYDRVPVSCQAGYNNVTMYTPLSDTANIFLNLKPLTPTFRPDVIAFKEPNPLLVTCISDGSRPAPTVRQWYVGNKDVTSNSTVISSTYDPITDTYTASSTLTYNVDRKFNGMILSCGFGNAVFGDLIRGTRVINIKCIPDTPTNLAEVDTTENTIRIQWAPGFDGGLKQSFVIQYRVKFSKDFQEAVVTNTDYKLQPGLINYTLTELKSGTKHEIRIISRNAAGLSHPSKPVTISTLCANCDCSNSSLIGVAVGLSTVIFFSLVVNSLFAYKLFTGTQKTQRFRKNLGKTNWNKTSTQEVYYNIAENIDDKDEQSTMRVDTYEELGSKDKPNTYEELKSKPDEQSAINLDTYEDLGTKEKPNEYEELKPKPSDPKFTSDTS